MSGGVFAVSRGVFEHPLFAKEKFTEREAWVWLIREAAWRERRTRAGASLVKLARGECAHSIRFMAEAWQWHRSKVERFLERLKIETMIETRKETGITVIKLCNYDEYQKVSLQSKTPEETQSETPPRQRRDRLEDIKNIKPSIPRRRAESSPEFERFRKAYPKRDGGQDWSKASESFESHCRSGTDPEDMIRGAAVYAGDCRRRGKEGTEFVKQAAAFLRGKHWPEWLEKAGPVRADGWPLTIDEPSARRLWLRGTWPDTALGPAPGQPGCRVPTEILKMWETEKSSPDLSRHVA